MGGGLLGRAVVLRLGLDKVFPPLGWLGGILGAYVGVMIFKNIWMQILKTWKEIQEEG